MTTTFTRNALAALAAALAMLLAQPAGAAPRRLAGADPTNCAACHGADKVLPVKHKAVKGLKLADCRECHTPGGDDSLSGKLPMSHAHMLAGKGCESCHGKGKPKPVDGDKCQACHEPGKLARQTAGVKPKNPHDSPHYGPTMECGNCHVAHGKSEDYCAQCHQFGFRVP